MSYLTGFENDIFISYTHVDNEPLLKGEEGWITKFHYSLEKRIHQLLGEPVRIWRDAKLQGIDYLSDTLQTQFPKTAVLIAVLSPRYIKSEWCLREIEEFAKAAKKSEGLKINNKSRCIKVVKTPLPREKQPPQLQGLLGYDFFEIEQATGKLREFRQDNPPNKDQKYWDKLEDLAQEVQQFLEMMKSPAKDGEEKEKKKSVYLAETTSDLTHERDKIKRELEQHGYRTFPDEQLPINTTILETKIRSYIKTCRLSVHLIGTNYGFIPEEETSKRSVVRVQFEVAAEFSTNTNFTRIIWLPPGLKPKEPEQEKFIEHLRNDPQAHKGAEILETPLEELKTIIHEKLRNGRQTHEQTHFKDGPTTIYFIHDQTDKNFIEPIKDYLFKKDYEVICPLFEGDETQLRKDHNENLVQCDAVLIHYGDTNPFWLRSKQRDLLKALGLGRSKPFLAKAIYVTAPEREEKRLLQTHEAILIHNYGAFDPACLQAFLNEIATNQGRGI